METLELKKTLTNYLEETRKELTDYILNNGNENVEYINEIKTRLNMLEELNNVCKRRNRY